MLPPCPPAEPSCGRTCSHAGWHRCRFRGFCPSLCCPCRLIFPFLTSIPKPRYSSQAFSFSIDELGPVFLRKLSVSGLSSFKYAFKYCLTNPRQRHSQYCIRKSHDRWAGETPQNTILGSQGVCINFYLVNFVKGAWKKNIESKTFIK